MLCHTGCILNILQHLPEEEDIARAAAAARAWRQAAATDLLWRNVHLSKWGEPHTRDMLARSVAGLRCCWAAAPLLPSRTGPGPGHLSAVPCCWSRACRALPGACSTEAC